MAGETLPSWVAGRDAERPALEAGGARLDYGGLRRVVGDLAARLAAAGLAPGDRALLVLPSGPEQLVALLAVGSLGGVAVPLDARSGAARLAHVAEATAPRLGLVGEEGPSPPGVESLPLSLDLRGPEVRVAGERLAATGQGAAGPRPGPGDPALIRFTSGSTGRPKGVVLTHGQQLGTARTLSRVFRLAEDHRELMVASMAYSGGWQRVAATLVAGGCVAWPETGPLSVPGLLEDLEGLGATGFFSPPPLVRLVLATPEARTRPALAGCRCIEIGSAAIAAEELGRLLDLAPAARVFVHYGLTECSRALILDARAHPSKLGSVGLPAPGVEVEVRDAAKRPLPAGRPGRIFLRGPQLARAYWEGPGRERPLGDWLATGDRGVLDADGFLTFLGREDDRINAGGHSFHPAEVERELGPVDGVASYLVVGVPDPRGVLGEVPVVLVVAAGGPGDGRGALLAAARCRLPPHMVPRRALAVAELPLTASGKPDRRRAAALFDASPGDEP